MFVSEFDSVRDRTDDGSPRRHSHAAKNALALAFMKRSGMQQWFRRTRNSILAAIALLLALPAQAQLTIDIIGGGATQTPIAVVPFAGEADFPLGITGVVGADLQRSGLFKLIDSGAARPAAPQDVRFPEFRSRGAEAVVIGSLTTMGPGQVNVRFYLLDAVKQTQIAAFSYNVAPTQFRAVAHTQGAVFVHDEVHGL